MKFFVIVVVIIFVGMAIMINSNPQNVSSSREAVKGYSEIQSKIADGATLLDVRTSSEFSAGHIKEATNHSLQEMQNGVMPNVDKNKTLYVYCQSGNRSAQATNLLKQAGFSNVIDLGAIQTVVKSGGEIIKN